MQRKLGHLTATLLLLLCVAVCALWVRGQSSSDWFHWTQTREHEWQRETLVVGGDGFYGSHQWFFFDYPGSARKYAENLGATSGFSHKTSQPQRNPYSGTFWNRLGFGMRPGTPQTDTSSDGPYRYVYSHAHVPYWFVLLVLSPPWCLWFALARARRRRARRARLGQCTRCGYDLRASPRRCPECGSVPEQSVETTA